MEVSVAVMEAVPEVFGSIKTMMSEMFDERYATVTEVVAFVSTAVVAVAKSHGGDSMSIGSSTTRTPKV